MLWFWLFGDVSRSLSIAVLRAFPTAWLLGRWLSLPLTIVVLVAQAAYCYMAEALDDGVASPSEPWPSTRSAASTERLRPARGLAPGRLTHDDESVTLLP